MVKKLLAIILTVASLLLVGTLAYTVNAATNGAVAVQLGTVGNQGPCGTYNSLTGTYGSAATFEIVGTELRISGTGPIGENAFQGRTDFTSVVIGSGITHIGMYAFDGCSSLTSVVIPNTVTDILRHAFDSSGLTSVTIPDSVTTIRNNVFQNCTSLASATWNSTLATIPDYTFSGCSSLTSFTIPSTVTTIGEYAFWGSGLRSITIPDSVTTMGTHVFMSCTSLTSATWNNTLTTIPMGTFNGCSSLTSFTIPSTVTTIGDYAFSSSGLTSITIPNSVTTMGPQVFKNCASLTTATWNSTLTTIPLETFNSCSSLQSFTIPSTVTTINTSAFSSSGLRSITIPDSVTTMESGVFYNCASLSTATWNNTLTTVPQNTFSYCRNLTTLTLGRAVTSFGGNAFYRVGMINRLYFNCDNLTDVRNKFSVANISNVTFGNTVRTIPDNLLAGANNLRSVTIPNSVQTIGGSAFAYTGLTSITIPDSVTTMGRDVFQSCSSLTSATWNSTLTTIPMGTFNGCSSLTSFTIPNTVTEIGNMAFYNSGLTDITIPDSVDTIGSNAFCDTPMDAAYFEGDLPSMYYDEVDGGDDPMHSFSEDAVILYYEPHNETWDDEVEFDSADNIFRISDFYHVANGTCGDFNWNWSNKEWDDNATYLIFDGAFRITGTGSIGEYTAYYGNREHFDDIGDVVIYDGIEGVGSYAFCGCQSLESVTFSDTVSWLGQYSFNETSLTSVTLPETITSMDDEVFPYCHDLESVTWNIDPNEVSYIPYRTFAACNSLESFEIPSGITEIGEEAFSGTGLTSIVIPDTVEYICDRAFLYSTLQSAYFEGDIPEGNLTPLQLNENAEEWARDSLEDIFGYSESNGEYIDGESNFERDWSANRPITGLDYMVGYWWSWDPVETWCEDEGYVSGDLAEWLTELYARNNDGRYIDFAGVSARIDAALALTEEPERYNALLEAWKDFYYIYDGDYDYSSFPASTVLYYDLGNEDWEGELVLNEDDHTFRLTNDDSYRVATNAVIFEDESGVIDYELLEENESVRFGTSDVPAIETSQSLLAKGWYDVKTGTAPQGSVACTSANVDKTTSQGITYASQTPMMKVLEPRTLTLSTVGKDGTDDKITGSDSYNEFDLFGVQIRDIGVDDGLRFVSSFSERALSALNALNGSVRYGYVAGVQSEINSNNSSGALLTKGMPGTVTIDCTKTGNNQDHRNFGDYRLFSLVITYDGADAANVATPIVARAYVTYTDANGVVRTHYNTYTGTDTRGGCCTSYSAAQGFVENVLRA